uniref:ABC-type spermidine/putrescine transport system, permease component II n=1 Tax=Eubacterium cellulosolvens (strain ATCC 43171 / JCM 9499 / 6) TaxID=633697 RepID=I5AUA8_EUBC6
MIRESGKRIFLGIMLILMYLPIVILAVYSFTDTANIGAIRGFSIRNYVTLFTLPELRDMIFGTFALALGSAGIATVFGTIGAIGAFYSRRKVKTAIGTLNQIPVVNADVVTGFSLCILLVVVCNVSKDTFVPLVIGHVTLCAPFVYLSVMPKIRQMDGSIYEAALDLGATPFKALMQIVIPQIVPGIVSGWALAITLSLDDYFIATYTKPATFDTISTYVVNATRGARTNIKTALWALSTVIFAIVILTVVVINVRAKRKEKGEAL